MDNRPLLLTLLAHLPGFDSCFPLIECLHRRGRVQVETWLGPRLRRTEPRVVQAFQRAGVPHREASLLRLEFGARDAIRRAGAVLTHSDPLAYGKRGRLRDRWSMADGGRVVFVQHGMKQMGLHYTPDRTPWQFHSELLLLWEEPGPGARDTVISLRPGAEIHICGMLKANRLPPAPPDAQIVARLASYRQRVLVCHNYGFESSLYSADQMARGFAMMAQVFAARPDTAFILRSHRGKRHKALQRDLDRLFDGLPNVLRAERHHGPWRFATIHDVLAEVDRVVSHPSTVILDALYEGRPCGVLDNTWPDLAPLHQIGGTNSLAAYLDDPEPMKAASAILARFGRIDANLERAAQHVEQFLGVGEGP